MARPLSTVQTPDAYRAGPETRPFRAFALVFSVLAGCGIFFAGIWQIANWLLDAL